MIMLQSIRVLLLPMCILLVAGCGPVSPLNVSVQEVVAVYGKPGDMKTVRKNDSIIHYRLEEVVDMLEITNTIRSNFFIDIIIPKGVYAQNGQKGDTLFFEPVSSKGKKVVAGSYDVDSIQVNTTTRKITINLLGEKLLWSHTNGFTILPKARVRESKDVQKMRSIAYGGSHKHLVSFIFKEGRTTQRLTHDVQQSNMFGYEGALIEILSYDDDSLTCKIIKNLDVFR